MSSDKLACQDTRAGALKTCNFSNIGPLRDELSGVDPQVRPCAWSVHLHVMCAFMVLISRVLARHACRKSMLWLADATLAQQLCRFVASSQAAMKQDLSEVRENGGGLEAHAPERFM